MNIRNIQRKETGLEIKIPDSIKTLRHNALQPVLFQPFLVYNPYICVAHNLLIYLQRSSTFRGSVSRLLLTLKKPFSPASTQTLSKWIKWVLAESGIDTIEFSAHSTQHASTSTAFRNGVYLDVIYKTAGWLDSSKVFATHYNRPLRHEGTLLGQSLLKLLATRN